MKERIAIVDGLRSPLCKSGGTFANIAADDLAAIIVRELVARLDVDKNEIDEVIIGNVAQPVNAMNIARVIALKAGLPLSVPAYTVHRNCASGMEALTSAADKIWAGQARVVVAGGVESMSRIPLLFGREMTQLMTNLMKSRTVVQKLTALSRFRPSFLKPVVGVIEGLTDPICNQIMGMTAENLAREFGIGRDLQDEYACRSHQKAIQAMDAGIFKEEMVPIPLPPAYHFLQDQDDGPRSNQSIEALAKLKPYFDHKNGTVTVGNSCPLTDGAGACLVMTESHAKKLGYKPIGYLKAYAYAGLEPSRMGLGPIYATSKVLDATKVKVKDIKLVELNEAFAVQVLANLNAFGSAEFAKTYLGKSRAIGAINPDILNVNGGAIALGHPVGMTGIRLVTTLLKEMNRRNLDLGLATLCVGGGQGASLLLEGQ